ncbi:MAG: glutamate-1-semialdehyde 2,1-aminomutase [Planctomycetota bacterium]
MDTDLHAALRSRARHVMPGGVSSPVRAFRAVGGEPIFYREAAGSRFRDVEGREFLDFVMSWGPMVLGHAEPRVVERVQAAVARGTSYGAPCEDEVRLAERVVDWHPAVEKLRFVSSGTEAVMSAIRLARGATGRDRILKFEGCYHGHSDSLLVAAGSGLVTFGRPSSAGVPEAFTALTSVLPLDDDAALEAFFAEHGASCAVAVIEPLPANNGLLPQRPAFLRRLRELCDVHGTLLLFDEVITGFRLGRGGATERSGVVPDLATFGKVLGGGLPVGAFGGPADLMDRLAPDGPVYQAGTLSGNPVAMAAGLATLDVLEEDDGWTRLEALGALLEDRLARASEGRTLPFRFVRVGSLFWLAPPGAEAPRAAGRLPADLGERYRPLWRDLLAQGLYLAPSAYEVGFLSTAHTEQEVELLARALAATAA